MEDAPCRATRRTRDAHHMVVGPRRGLTWLVLAMISLLCHAAVLEAQALRLGLDVGQIRAYDANGPFGALSLSTGDDTRLHLGVDASIGRTLLAGSSFVHRTIVSVGPILGVSLPIVRSQLSLVVDGTGQLTRLSVEYHPTIPEGEPRPADRQIGGRTGVSYGGSIGLNIAVSQRFGLLIQFGILHHSIYENRTGNMRRVTLGARLGLD